MSAEDMCAISELSDYGLENIHEVRAELSSWFLIEDNGE